MMVPRLSASQQRLIDALDTDPQGEVYVYDGGRWNGAWVGRFKSNRAALRSLVRAGILYYFRSDLDENGTSYSVYRVNGTSYNPKQ